MRMQVREEKKRDETNVERSKKRKSLQNHNRLMRQSVTDWLYDPFNKIWNAETIPEDWCKGLII